MASWLHSRLKAAEGLLEAVDRTAKVVKENTEPFAAPNSALQRTSLPGSIVDLSSSQELDVLGRSLSELSHQRSLQQEEAIDAALNSESSQDVTFPNPEPVQDAGEPKEVQPGFVVKETQIGNLLPSAPIAMPMLQNSVRSPQVVAIENGTRIDKEATKISPGTDSLAPTPAVERLGSVSSFRSPSVARDTSPEESNSENDVLLPANAISMAIQTGLSPYKSKEANRRVLEQELDEARDLTESAGQGATVREARLLRMLERFRARLDQYKTENQQLEELLQQADARYHGGAGAIEELEDQLAKSEVARVSAEAALAQTTHSKDAEIARLTELLCQAREQVEGLEGDVESLHHSNELLQQKHKDNESSLLQTLREEVAAMEAKYTAECRAHSATRQANEGREHDLEANIAESASALAAMQRVVTEKDAQIASLREQHDAAQKSLASLQQHEAPGSFPPSRSPAADIQHSSELLSLRSQCDFLRVELHKAQTARQAAENEVSTLQEECVALQQQCHDSTSTAALEQRLHQVSELLYIKQTQLERLASEKAAQQMALEREMMAVRDEAERMKRRVSRGRDFCLEEVVPMDAIGEAYYKLANHQRVGPAVQAGARFVDLGASTVVRVLRQYPLARLAAFLYILFLHLSVYFLLQHLQKRAMSLDRALLEKEALHH